MLSQLMISHFTSHTPLIQSAVLVPDAPKNTQATFFIWTKTYFTM